MTTAFLSMLLAAQLLAQPTLPVPAQSAPVHETRLWWGMIDPELSLWFSRLPLEEADDTTILWDFSWRSFLAAVFVRPLLMEEVPDAAHA